MHNTNNNMYTEQRNEKTKELDQLSVKDIIQVMNNEDRCVVDAVRESLPQVEYAIEQIVEVMIQGGRLYYIGAGTSGRLGVLDASECPPTFGVEPELVTGIIAGGKEALTTAVEDVEDDQDAGRADVLQYVTSKDVVIGISASGHTPYVLGAIQEAKKIGALTVGLSCNQDTPLSELSECRIEVLVGPEIITGSTRLKAGTSEKMVLNMISTTTMIKLGKVYGNLMVNVQAKNAKLKDRVVSIIREVTGVSYEIAKEYSEKANGDARTAILMIKYKLDYTTVVKALDQANDNFRKAMEIIEFEII